jgi:hypothetical protein
MFTPVHRWRVRCNLLYLANALPAVSSAKWAPAISWEKAAKKPGVLAARNVKKFVATIGLASDVTTGGAKVLG